MNTNYKAIMYNPEWTPEYNRHARLRWVENPSDGMRFVGKVHEIQPAGEGNLPYFHRALIDHRGWYIDSFQDETVCGEVYQLPARNGKSVYVPAVSDANNNAAAMDFTSTTDDLKDAIRWADSMAESYAEYEREYHARDMANTRIEEIQDEVKQIYATVRELCRELRANCEKLTGLDAVKAAIRREVTSARRKVRKLNAQRRKLENDFWAIEPGY